MAKARPSLAEIMGTHGSTHGDHMTLEHLPKLLGDMMPEMPRNQLGRHRLIRALQQRFGDNFRALPGVKNLISEFDRELEFERKVAAMSAVKYRKESKHG